MKDLLSSLTGHPMALLRAIAELRGASLASNARDEAAAQLAATLAEPAAVGEALRACSPAALAAWEALVAAGGRMKAPAFLRQHGAIRPVGPGKLAREQVWQQPASPAEELWYRGLIYRIFANLGDGPTEYVYIPSDFLPQPEMGRPSADRPIFGDFSPVQPPPRVKEALNSLAVDVCGMLAALRDAPARADNAGRLHQAERARLSEGLLLADPVRLDLIVALARQRGWLASERGRLVVQAQPTTVWLRSSPWEQVTALFVAWRDSTEAVWNDLRRVPSLQAEGEWRNDPLLARRGVLDALASLDPAAWCAVDDLAAAIKASRPDFQRPDGGYSGWYLRDLTTGRYLSGFESWDEVEGRLIRFLLAGPLFWLGVVALAREEAAGREVFRMTTWGRAWLSDTLPPMPPQPARLAVADDFTVTAPLLLPLLERFRLLRFTEPAPGPYDLPQPTRHRITRGSLARARAAGIKAEAAAGFLRRAGGGRLPVQVETALARWDQHGGAVRITRGAVLRVTDAAILSAFRSDPALAPLLGELLSAQAVLVREANLPRLLQALEAMGYGVREDQ